MPRLNICNPGRRVHRVVFEKKTVAQGSTGEQIETWTANRTVRGEREDLQGNERFRASQELAVRVSVFTVPWFSELTAGDWRINHESLIWDIEGIAEPKDMPPRRLWKIAASAVRV